MSAHTARPLLLPAAGLIALLALALWLYPRTAPASTSAAEASMRNAITSALDGASPSHALWGVYVQNLRTGEVVASRNAAQSFLPASTLKLVTTAAALQAHGPNHRYLTRLYFNGTPVESTLRGDLIIRGGGDPTFGGVLTGRDPLAEWARQLRAMGVERFEGRIIGDASAIDSSPYAPGWDVDYVATAHYAAPAGGLSYSDNVANVQIAGTRPGDPAEVSVRPSGHLQFQGDLRTRSGRGFSPLRVERIVGTNTVTLEGAVTANYRGTVRIPVHDPAHFAMTAFADHLQRAGITVDAQVIDASNLQEGLSYDADPLFVHASPPLSEILGSINRRSNNLYAEQVYRSLGASGTSRGANQRILSMLNGAGISTTGLLMSDGSGLSRKNFITPQSMGQLLAHLYSSDLREPYLASLARGGEPNTTLQYRFGGTQVWAKTGTLHHARALAGYAMGPGNTPYAFVLIANNFTDNPTAISATQNQIVQAITSGGR